MAKIEHSGFVMKISGEALSSDGELSSEGLSKIAKILSSNLTQEEKSVQVNAILLKYYKRPCITKDKVNLICDDIIKIHEAGKSIAVVSGAGNIWRGRQFGDFDKVNADYIGMQAININSHAIYLGLKDRGYEVYFTTKLFVDGIVERFVINNVRNAFNSNVIVIVGGGTGSPGCSTDLATTQLAFELEADGILFGKSIDGIYSGDPRTGDAIKYDILTHEELVASQLSQGIQTQAFMDHRAALMLGETKINLYAYLGSDPTAIDEILRGNNPGTIVTSDPELLAKRKIFIK